MALRAAVERRYYNLVDTAGLNQDVFDSLVILAAGRWTPAAVAAGYQKVLVLQAEMDEGRERRLVTSRQPTCPRCAAATSSSRGQPAGVYRPTVELGGGKSGR